MGNYKLHFVKSDEDAFEIHAAFASSALVTFCKLHRKYSGIFRSDRNCVGQSKVGLCTRGELIMLNTKLMDKISKEIVDLPLMKGRWRKEPYASRAYEPIEFYVPTTAVSDEEGSRILNLLSTPLDGFLGQAYNYNDSSLTEQWMSSFASDGTKVSPSFDEINRTQIEIIVEILINRVQDRVCTEAKYLDNPVLKLGSEVLESPVWGIDYSTRRHIELVIETANPEMYSTEAVRSFIEKCLLPAINAQIPMEACKMNKALEYIIKAPTCSQRDKIFAETLLSVIPLYDSTHFRIHPKGSGVICNKIEGIKPHVVATEYLGELYPPYRWCEKLDVIEMAQSHFGLKPTLPDFYNILLERPSNDPLGYALLFVDASQKANLGSSCSHSCDPNCTSSVVSRNGKLTIVLTTNRHINYGEELCMDYCSITSSVVEARAAVCLCGTTACRGAFLRLSTQDELQQIFNSKCGPLMTFTWLLRSCVPKPMSEADRVILATHGLLAAALGDAPPPWMRKFAADLLRFIEFERKALPCALMRTSPSSVYTYTFVGADGEARSVMEQRLQSLVCCCSLLNRVLSGQPDVTRNSPPLSLVPDELAISRIWRQLAVLPSLLEKYLLRSRTAATDKQGDSAPSQNEVARDDVKACVKEIRAITTALPKHMIGLREAALTIRRCIMGITNASNPLARLELLCDVLLLWAYTTTYVSVQKYAEVRSDPISILARELGTNIRRSMLSKKSESRRSPRVKNTSASTKHRQPSPTNSHVSSTPEHVFDDVSTTSSTSNAHADTNKDLADVKVFRGSDDSVGSGIDESLDKIYDQSSTMEDSTDPSGDVKVEVVVADDCSRDKDRDRDDIVPPNEVVYSDVRVYGEHFIFELAMGWVHAGTDEKVHSPELFGCAQLPLPSQCFGQSDKRYGAAEKALLAGILGDDVKQTWPWPQSLRACFSTTEGPVGILGSPMLDAALGSTWSIRQVVEQLGACGSEAASKLAMDQYDQKLPPEAPSNWIQCDLCSKWRRVRWDVDETAFTDKFTCSMNYWNVENANCDVPSDYYDPDKEGDIINDSFEGNASLEQYVLGTYRDVYCTINKTFYEAKIISIKPPTENVALGLVLFHFKGWSSKTDEWIEAGSPRIQPHHTQTRSNKLKIANTSDVSNKKRKVINKIDLTGSGDKKISSRKRAADVQNNYVDELPTSTSEVFLPGQSVQINENSSKRKRKSNHRFFEDFTS